MSQHGKSVKGALPCGNPNRYLSADVVRFKDHPKGSQNNDAEDQTESGQYIKTLLKHQINKDVTLNEHFSKHRDFIGSSSHAPSVSNLKGLHNVKKHVELDEYDSSMEYLKSCGLTDKEIQFALSERFPEKVKINSSGYGAHPIINQQLSEEVEKKLTEKEAVLSQPDTFNGGLELSRQGLLLEKSVLEKQNRDGTLPEFLFKRQKLTVVHPDHPINHIPEILSDIHTKPERLPRRERRKQRKLNRKLLRQQEYLDIDSTSDKTEQIVNHIETDEYSQFGEKLSKETDILDVNIETNDQSSLESECVSVEPSLNTTEPTDNRNEDEGSPTKAKRKKQCADLFGLKDFGDNIQFVTDKEIQGNKMSIEEILEIDKFKNYNPGNPSQTMFVKNLPTFVSGIDLVSLFGQYERVGANPISFRLLNGRMKGHAFVTFPDIATCQQAIAEVNGYKFGGKPIVLSFGRNGNNNL